MKTLVIAEKGSQAEDLKKGLEKYGVFKKGDRFYESDKYIITWAQGHILSLMEPRDYDNWGDRKWELDALPWYPPSFNFEYKVDDKVKTIYGQLKSIFKRNDIAEIVVSTDAGREGTLIAHELIDHFGVKVPVKRNYDSASPTPSNIQRIFESGLKGNDFIEPRVKAAYARAFADLLLGMNFTIGFTAKAGPLLSMGRVKTPTMAILAHRKKEILNFKEETYFELEADFGGIYKGVWFKEQKSNTRIEKTEDVFALKEKLNGKSGLIVKKEVKQEPENPKLLFSLTTLQREASKKFGFDPDETLDIAQSLYDSHKILSYPRTESEVIGTEHVSGLKTILESVNLNPYGEFVQYVLDKGIPTNNRLVNDKKLTDHHAIIPTEVSPKLDSLNEKERKIYDMVVKRFLSAFYPAAVYEKTEVVTEVEGETFKTSGKIEVDKGWKVVYGTDVETEDDEKKEESVSVIPPIEKGESREIQGLKENPKKTNPPKLYTFDTLLGAMTNPKRFLQSQELKDALDSAEAEAGLGTPATRAEILKELLAREYIIKKGKNLDISDFGMKLIEVCPEKLKSPEITAEWEGKLRKMELNQYDYDNFMSELRLYIESILDELRVTQLSVSFPQSGGGEEIAKCPFCSGSIRERKWNYSCDNHSSDNQCFSVSKEIAKKKISESHVKELATKGITKEIKGFVGSKGKFDIPLKLDETKKVVFAFGATAEKIVASCPFCSTDIKERRFNFSCENHSNENKCFSVSKEIAKKKIPESAVKELATKGITKEISGFVGSKGTFSVALKFDEDKKIVFAFDNKPKSAPPKSTKLSCPFCQKGEVQESPKAFGCSNWKEGCKFSVWKNGTAITINVIEELIANGETAKIENLTSSKGTKFNAKLKLDIQNKKVSFEY